ncbi:MAG: tRNA (adenosine(37)-N6)-threonylcarbamoyltransferase complex dimerization subunit type 1 TsaB [Acidimicrobiales bacterium]|jgi:tRNA threonylcarbamoyladenosine biosynthesis protein TsaB|nr:MAG: peptidase M22 family protein [marine actinobacterium MedAcidi-G1]MCH1513632.1 tRNA (adenosine(37)-N6)-threonylcarbamoyltransferase complex dimerization subunit type 1 TsaB [Acidimicrobiales bacterium]HAQ05010.1 tRNA (adenosine(37)-N6)-threonylcarbamoyltransferase complex dimerization subunit type 1 TsaB [Acidimicrobiaceae bacterium]|tara:strand:- start:1011 stop:1712 length:702 start_codon:yes stop_codon:yes gene_type:complete
MLILAIETASSQAGCAIGGHEGVLASAHSGINGRHAENISPQIAFIKEQAGINYSELGAIAVDIGPGLFTGLRVGVATAVSIAHALTLPVIGISSLDLLAFPARWTSRLIVSAMDARRGELFTALFRRVPGGIQRVRDANVCTAEDLAAEIQTFDESILLVGDGALRYAEVFESLGRVELAEQGLAHPSARAMVQLAHARAMREEFVQPWDLEPIYLRKPDAEINWSTRNNSK